jgi:hypothetical protein
MSTSKDFLGHAALKDITTAGTVFHIPFTTIRPRNPLNFSYLPTVNASSYPSVATLGARAPSIQIATFIKASWFNAALVNSLIVTQSASGDTDDWAVGIYDTLAAAYRVYDWGKCTHLEFAGNASGGTQTMQIGFENLFGDSELGATAINGKAQTIFSAAGTVPDAGQAVNISQVGISGATKVRSYRLSLVRGQMVQRYFSQSLYGTEITTGMFSGVLTLEQEPTGTIASTGVVLTIAGVNFSLTLNQDEFVRDISPSMGTMVNSYSLINLTSGGSPVSIA